jgi:hypothetical protein
LKNKELNKMHEFIDPSQILEEYGGTLKMPVKIWPPCDSYTPEQRQTVMPINQPEGPIQSQKYQYVPRSNPALFCKYSKAVHESPIIDAKKLDYEEEMSLYTIPQESRARGLEIFDDQLVLEFQSKGLMNTHQTSNENQKLKEFQNPSMLLPAAIEPPNESDLKKTENIEEVKLKIKENKTSNHQENREKKDLIGPANSPVPIITKDKNIPLEKRSGCCSGGCTLI